ncbi:MAG TPA: LiaF-related protein [Chitinophagaceae bacterium]|nr:LiaF-related protein [Chitinophagaceae bacterium]
MTDENETRFEARFHARRKRWEYRAQNRSKHGHIWTGIFIILVGVAALIKVSVEGLPAWLFSWQMFLIALGLFIGFKHKFRGSAWFVLILLGTAFMLRDMYPEVSFRPYIWPSVLVLIGILIVLRPRSNRCEFADEKKNDLDDDDTYSTSSDRSRNRKTSGIDYLTSTSIFSGSKKNIISKDFKGGDVVNIFGGSELDLSQADIKETASIEITNIFGGSKLIIPAHWHIKSEAVMIFGGLDDRRKVEPNPEQEHKTLIIKGTILFGGVDVRSY